MNDMEKLKESIRRAIADFEINEQEPDVLSENLCHIAKEIAKECQPSITASFCTELSKYDLPDVFISDICAYAFKELTEELMKQ